MSSKTTFQLTAYYILNRLEKKIKPHIQSYWDFAQHGQSLGYNPEEDFEKPESMKRRFLKSAEGKEGAEEGSEEENSDLMNGHSGVEATRSSSGESYFE